MKLLGTALGMLRSHFSQLSSCIHSCLAPARVRSGVNLLELDPRMAPLCW
jgi:hypothetical protein